MSAKIFKNEPRDGLQNTRIRCLSNQRLSKFVCDGSWKIFESSNDSTSATSWLLLSIHTGRSPAERRSLWSCAKHGRTIFSSVDDEDAKFASDLKANLWQWWIERSTMRIIAANGGRIKMKKGKIECMGRTLPSLGRLRRRLGTWRSCDIHYMTQENSSPIKGFLHAIIENTLVRYPFERCSQNCEWTSNESASFPTITSNDIGDHIHFGSEVPVFGQAVRLNSSSESVDYWLAMDRGSSIHY